MRSARRPRPLLWLLLLTGLALALPGGARAGKPNRVQLGFEAQDGFTATALFQASAIPSALSEWALSSTSGFEMGYASVFAGKTLAVDEASGEIYVLVRAWDRADDVTVVVDEQTGSTTDVWSYLQCGVVRVDASGSSPSFETVLQTSWSYPDNDDPDPLPWDYDLYDGEDVHAVDVVPATAVNLPAGHLVLARWTASGNASLGMDDRFEIVLYDPDTETEVDVLVDWPSGYAPYATLKVGPDGTIYVVGHGFYFDETRQDEVADVVLALSPTKTADGAGGYDYGATVTTLAADLGANLLAVTTAPDGSVYAYDAMDRGGDVYEVDPDTDTSALYATFAPQTYRLDALSGLAWSTGGTFWLSGLDQRSNLDFVAPVTDGSEVTVSDAVAVGKSRGIQSVAGDADGSLLVVHDDYELDGSGNPTFVARRVYRLEADASGGDGGDGGSGGGGKGGGKGKNK